MTLRITSSIPKLEFSVYYLHDLLKHLKMFLSVDTIKYVEFIMKIRVLLKTILFLARDHFGHSPLHKSVMANQEEVLR